jgi:hypothetical protein
MFRMLISERFNKGLPFKMYFLALWLDLLMSIHAPVLKMAGLKIFSLHCPNKKLLFVIES